MCDSRVYLRGVDLVALSEKYLKGEYMTLTSPLSIDVSTITQESQAVVTIQENINNMSYQLDLGTNKMFACIGYKVTDKNGSYASLDPNKRYNCMYCLRKIDGTPLGIPIRRDEKYGKIYYHMIDIFCGWSCWKTEIRKRLTNAMYSQSMVYAGEIYNKCTGKNFADLKCASDHRLLEIFNGPMSWEEFHTNTVTYSEKPGLQFGTTIYTPVSNIYSQDWSFDIVLLGKHCGHLHIYRVLHQEYTHFPLVYIPVGHNLTYEVNGIPKEHFYLDGTPFTIDKGTLILHQKVRRGLSFISVEKARSNCWPIST